MVEELQSLKERIKKLGLGAATAISELSEVTPSEVSKVQRNSRMVSQARVRRVEQAVEDIELVQRRLAKAQAESNIPITLNMRDIENLKKFVKFCKDNPEVEEFVDLPANSFAEEIGRQFSAALEK
jgi:predicted transcriptional regulator